jgi:predicted hydrocarbon binding protein/KaiC/GvpD/RAD55 family RecA-like ATPase
MILLVGPPGSGKTTFCEQTILQNLAIDRPIIYVTTEYAPSDAERGLRERGLLEVKLGLLCFVDAFDETVGVSVPDRPDTEYAYCNDLSSIDIAISKTSERMRGRDILLVFDSLMSPYLFSGPEILKFTRQTLSRFASTGNAVMACIDEGCTKSEDLVTLMSLCNGVIKMETRENRCILDVVKHLTMRPGKIETIMEPRRFELKPTMRFDPDVFARFFRSFQGKEKAIRKEVGDFVNLFWPNLSHWSGILWDPQGFPTMVYELNKEDAASARDKEFLKMAPTSMRLMTKLSSVFQSLGLFMPKSFSKVKDMKNVVRAPGFSYFKFPEGERSGILEYLEDASRTDEHYFRLYEGSDCSGFENMGSTMASHIPPCFAGFCKALETEERDWNAIETRCVGKGDPYCEFKLIPGEIRELKESLEKDSLIVERIHERLMDRLEAFMLQGKPLIERPRLGSDVHLHVVMHAMGFPHLAGERYRMAQRMGGSKSGQEIGERLINAGVREDDVVKRLQSFIEYCKVGKISIDDTIRITENCESLRTLLFSTMRKEPCCFFTTGFLNGFFSAVKSQHVKETRCIVLGDPYCEWEFT